MIRIGGIIRHLFRRRGRRGQRPFVAGSGRGASIWARRHVNGSEWLGLFSIGAWLPRLASGRQGDALKGSSLPATFGNPFLMFLALFTLFDFLWLGRGRIYGADGPRGERLASVGLG